MLFNAIRAVPELIVAMLLLTVTGLGPWAGALAIGLHSVGTLGKLSTEVIETSDEGPLEAITAAGGTFVEKMRWGMVPQVLPTVIGYWLFRFEINVRASAVLGLIGAGGIGGELGLAAQLPQLPRGRGRAADGDRDGVGHRHDLGVRPPADHRRQRTQDRRRRRAPPSKLIRDLGGSAARRDIGNSPMTHTTLFTC